MPDAVTAYARAVVRGRVPAGLWQRLACERHLREIAPAWRRAHDLRWDAAQAERVCAIISRFVQYQGEWAGRPLELQPWQRFIVGSLHGWRRRADGARRFRTAFVEVPRGNGKSAMAAALGVYGAFLDGEPGAHVYSVATKRDQARIVFEHARQMVRHTPALKARVTVQNHNLHQLDSASKFEALSSDAHTLDGLRPHVVIADEVHAHPDGSVIEIMLTGMGTRRQPLLFEITTAGVDRHGPWWAHREYTRGLLEQAHEDPAWFGVIFGADTDADWTDPATWAVANPGYGQQVKPDFFANECRKAQQILGYQNTFRRLHLGQLVEQQDRYLDMRAWDASITPVEASELTGRPCVAGLDLSTRTDLTACVLVFADEDGGVTVLPHMWCPEAGIDKRSRIDRVPYAVWVQQGYLTPTPGHVVDYDQIRADLVALGAQYRITELAFDPWNATQIATQLQAEGFRVVELRQGFRSLSEPTKHLAALVAEGKLRHGGHPMLRWMARNLVVREDANGNVAPDKSKATDRIDGMVALIMGLARLTVDPSLGASIYERRDLLVLGEEDADG
jgi:phage terminase large subunit-like protein